MAVFYNPRPQYFDDDGKPLGGGTLTFYIAGTSTEAVIYDDSGLTTPGQNPSPLNSAGRVRDGGIWLSDGEYKVILKDSNGVQIDGPIDGFEPGGGSGGSGSGATVIDTIAQLRLTDSSEGYVWVGGYYSLGDYPGNYYVWDAASTEDDNGGTIISDSPAPASGRWIMVPKRSIDIRDFGVIDGVEADLSTNLLNANAWCASTGQDLLIYDGTYRIDSDTTLIGPYKVVFKDGAEFISNGSADLTIETDHCLNESQSKIQGTGITLNWNPSDREPVDVLNYGAAGDGVTDDTSFFQEAVTNVNNEIAIKISRPHAWNSVYVGTVSNLIFKGGYITFGTSASAKIGEWVNKTNKTVFRGRTDLSTYEKKVVDIEDFIDPGVIDQDQYGYMVDGITSDGSSPKTLKWSNSGYRFDSTPSSSRPNSITHDIASGSNIAFATIFNFGTVLGNKKDIFLVGSVGFPKVLNSEVYPQWWGADQNASDSSAALQKAFDCQANSGQNSDQPVWVNGLGIRCRLESTVSITNSLKYRLKNCGIEDDGSLINAIFCQGTYCLFDKVTFEITSGRAFQCDGVSKTVANQCVFIGGSAGQEGNFDATYSGCDFSGSGTIEFNGVGNLNIEGSKIDQNINCGSSASGSFLINSSIVESNISSDDDNNVAFEINGNKIQGNVTLTDSGLQVTPSKRTIITGNDFIGSDIDLGWREIVFTGNQLDTFITLNGELTGSDLEGVIITNNITSGTGDNVRLININAATTNQVCIISENLAITGNNMNAVFGTNYTSLF